MSALLNSLNVALFLYLVVGSFLHHNRTLHVRMMLLGFLMDVALLLAVEFSDSAVAQALRMTEGAFSPLLATHLVFAIGGLALWVLQLQTGFQIVRKGRMELLPRHAKGARWFLLFRLGNVVTALML